MVQQIARHPVSSSGHLRSGADEFTRHQTIGEQTFHAESQERVGDGVIKLREQHQQVQPALLKVQLADELQSHRDVAAINHDQIAGRKRPWRICAGISGVRQEEFAGGHDLEAGTLQQPEKSFLGDRVTAKEIKRGFGMT